ncbi:hypothetical protein [Spirosoma pulveris]
MRYRLSAVCLLLVCCTWVVLTPASGQSSVTTRAQKAAQADSIWASMPKLSFRHAPWYARTMPLSVYTGPGKMGDRLAQNVEVGKSFGVLDVGVAFGRNSVRPDTTLFVEGRATLDAGNVGIFASEITIGAGKLFDTRGSLMLELSYTIFAQIGRRLGVGLISGYFDFSNEHYDSSKTYYGIYFRYGLPRTDSGGLLSIGGRSRARHSRRSRVR